MSDTEHYDYRARSEDLAAEVVRLRDALDKRAEWYNLAVNDAPARAERAEAGYETMLESLNRVESENARLTECLEAMNDSADILDSKIERLTAQLQAVREWAQGLISSDDTTRWSDHCPNMHGRQALAVLDAAAD